MAESKIKAFMRQAINFISYIQAALLAVLAEAGVALNWLPTVRAFVLATAAALMFVFTGYIKEVYGLNGTVKSAIDKINTSVSQTAAEIETRLKANAQVEAEKIMTAAQEVVKTNCPEVIIDVKPS